MTTDNFCFYLQSRLIQPVKQEVNGTVILSPLVFLALALLVLNTVRCLKMHSHAQFESKENAWQCVFKSIHSKGSILCNFVGVFWPNINEKSEHVDCG
jgi:hypothetical protein